MAKYWHSTERDVYHNNIECYDGNNIEKKYYKSGTGSKRLCKTCEKLNKKK